MNIKLAVAALAALSPAALAAQPSEPQPILKASGQGQYEVWCTVTSTTGHEETRYLKRGHELLALGRAVRANWNYRITSQSLTVSLSGYGWVCPFAGAPEAACEHTFDRGSGSFELRRKSR